MAAAAWAATARAYHQRLRCCSFPQCATNSFTPIRHPPNLSPRSYRSRFTPPHHSTSTSHRYPTHRDVTGGYDDAPGKSLAPTRLTDTSYYYYNTWTTNVYVCACGQCACVCVGVCVCASWVYGDDDDNAGGARGGTVDGSGRRTFSF